jgi:hypothetical protein
MADAEGVGVENAVKDLAVKDLAVKDMAVRELAVEDVAIKGAIHAKAVQLASQLGNGARKLQNLIPARGFLDLAGLMERVMWFEFEHGYLKRRHYFKRQGGPV